MECKICHKELATGMERCSYCGAKVVVSNYGGSNVVGNPISSQQQNGISNNSNQPMNSGGENNATISENTSFPNSTPQTNTYTNENTEVLQFDNISTPEIQNEKPIQNLGQNIVSVSQPENIQPTESVSNSPQPDSKIQVNLEELRELYIGKKYSKLTHQSFSFTTFFFGPIYMCYRKQYVSAIILFVAFFISSYFMTSISTAYFGLLYLGCIIYYACTFSKEYIKSVDKKIIMGLKNGGEKDLEKYKKKLAMESSTSTLLTVLVIIGYIIYIVVSIFIQVTRGIGQVFDSVEESVLGSIGTSVDGNNTELPQGSYKTIGDKNFGYIKVPSTWNQSKDSDTSTLIYVDQSSQNQMILKVSSIGDVKDALDAERANYNGGYSIVSVNSAGTAKINGDDYQVRIRGIEHDNKTYLATVIIYDNQTEYLNLVSDYKLTN